MCIRDRNTSEGCAQAVRHALAKLVGEENAEGILFGQMTDSGGGGTGKSFRAGLMNQNVAVAIQLYLTAFCTLHCAQLTLLVPVKHVLGEGGRDKDGKYKQNAMQLLHGVYNMQSKHETGEWKLIVHHTAGQKGLELTSYSEVLSEIPCPILTRWWTVGVAAVFVLKHWALLYDITEGVI